MPSYIYRPHTLQNRTLVDMTEKHPVAGQSGVATGKGMSAPIDTKDFQKVAKDLKLSGSLVKKLKTEDHESGKEKRRKLSPIKIRLDKELK